MAQDPVNEYVKALNTTNSARDSAWESVYAFREGQIDADEFNTRLKSLPFSDEIRDDLWGMGHGNAVAPRTEFAGLHGAPESPTRGALDALGTFLGTAGSELVVEPAKGLYEIGQATMRDPVGTGAQLARGLAGAQAEQFGKAGEAFREGRYVEGLGHGAAGVVPILGPGAVRAGETIGRGNVAEGLGQAAAMLTPMGVAGAMRRVRPLKPTGPVPMTRGERTGSRGSLFAEQLTEKTIPGSRPFAGFRSAQQQAMNQYADDVANRISNFQGPSHQVGVNAQRAINDARNALKASSQRMYRELDDLMSQSADDLAVDMRPLKSFAQRELARLERSSGSLPTSETSRMRQVFQRIIDGPDSVGFEAAQDIRSSYNGMVKNFANPLPDRQQATLMQMGERITSAMDEAASRVPRARELWREANDSWRTLKNEFEGTIIEKIAKSDRPEQLHVFLRSAPLDDVDRIRNTVSPEAWSQMRGRVLQDMMEQARTGEHPRGFAQVMDDVNARLGAKPTTPEVTFSGKKFQNELEKLQQHGRISHLFSPEEQQGLLEVSRLASKIQQNQTGMAGLIAGGINASLIYPFVPFTPMGLRVPSLSGMASAAGAGTSLYVVGQVMTRPQGLTLLRRFLRSWGAGNRPATLAAGAELTRYVNELGLNDPQGSNNTVTPTQPQGGRGGGPGPNQGQQP